MKVENLLQFLHTLEEPLRATGGTKAANELKDACDNLLPFALLTVGDFAQFLKTADHYVKTGELPLTAKKTTSRKAKTVDFEKIKAVAQTVTDLYERAIDDDLNYGEIEAQLKKIEKGFSKDELVALCKEVNIVKTIKTKKDAFEAMRERIFSRKQSYEQTRF